MAKTSASSASAPKSLSKKGDHKRAKLLTDSDARHLMKLLQYHFTAKAKAMENFMGAFSPKPITKKPTKKPSAVVAKVPAVEDDIIFAIPVAAAAAALPAPQPSKKPSNKAPIQVADVAPQLQVRSEAHEARLVKRRAKDAERRKRQRLLEAKKIEACGSLPFDDDDESAEDTDSE